MKLVANDIYFYMAVNHKFRLEIKRYKSARKLLFSGSYNTPLASSTQDSDVQDCGVSVEVS